MAVSGSVSTGKYQGRYYTVSWTATQDVNTNKSTVKWTLKAVGGSASWYAERTLKVSVSSSNTLSGTTSYSKTSRVERYTGTIKTGTFTVTHNANGDASFKISVQAAVYVSTVNCTGSATFTLNNIPRKSTLSVGNGTLGTAQTLTVTRKSTSFTHTITATCGSASTTIATKSTSTSISFIPPIAWASQNTTGTSLSVTYTITTYNGSTSVGSNSYTVTCSIPSSVKPSCSVAVTDAMGYADTYGAFIKGLSKFKVVVTPTTSYGSAIASYSTTSNGATYTASSFTTGVLNSSGTLTVNATVKDKRGRSGSASKSLTVLNYAVPKIESLTVHRCNADGSENNEGGHVKVTFSGSVTSLNNKNSASYVLKYKKSSDSSYTSKTFSEHAGKYAVTDASFIFEADTGSSYDVQLQIKDDFHTTTQNTSASTAFTLMHWSAGGTGMGIGKLAEEEGLLDIGIPVRIKSEWVNMTLSSSFKVYSDNPINQPKYKERAGIVTIKGAVSPVTEYTSSTEGVTIASGIPSALRPSENLQFVCQGSGMNRWNCSVNTDGTIKIARYGTTDATTVPASAWLAFCVTYQV